MAGEFDDLIPGGAAAGGSGGGTFDDLIAQSPEQQRRDRLRKIASTSMRQADGEPGAGDIFANNVTLGLQKPVGGLASAIGGEIGEFFGGEPASFGERYTAQTGAYSDRLAEAEKNSGWGGTAAGLAGSVFAGGPARSAGTSLWSMLRDAALLGGVEGAANKSDSLGEAAEGALGGAATAAGTTGALSLAGKAVNRMRPSFRERRANVREANRGTPPETLKNQSRAVFQQLDNGGIAYDNMQSTDLVDNALGNLEGYDASPGSVHAPLHGVIAEMEQLRGQPLPFGRLKKLREKIGAAAGSNEPQVRRIAGSLLADIDGYVTNQTPALSQIPGDQVGPLWQEARRLWRTAGLAEDMGWRLDNADLRASSTNSGQNTDNAIRQNVRAVHQQATKPRRYNPYSPDELAQMRRVIEGTTGQNLLRYGGNGLAGFTGQALGGAGTAMGGFAGFTGALDPMAATALSAGSIGAGMGIRAIGHGMKEAAARQTETNADDLIRLISTGSLNGGRQAMQPTREELAAAMLARSLGRYTGMEATQ